MTQVASTTSYPKLNIHKFQDIKPKLDRDSWSSWNREILATVREGGIYAVINGTDITCNTPNSMTSLTQLMDEWHDRNNFAYNQILLHVSRITDHNQQHGHSIQSMENFTWEIRIT